MWQFTRGYQILQHFAMVFPFFPDGKKHHFPVDFPSLPRCRSRWLLLWGRRPRSPANGKLLYLYRHTFVYLLLSCFIFNLDWIICCLFLIILFIHVSVCLSMCCLYIELVYICYVAMKWACNGANFIQIWLWRWREPIDFLGIIFRQTHMDS